MIFVTKFKEHKKYRKKLLELIDQMPQSPKLNTADEVISKNDFHFPRELNRPYIDFFVPLLNPYLADMANKFKSKSIRFHNMWFQQYKKNDTHAWHNHPESNFSHVYYLELPSIKIATKFLNVRKKLSIKEGDILTFPGHLYHCSPINNTTLDRVI